MILVTDVFSGRVHFSQDTDEMGNTAIAIKEKAEGSEYEAHVGFLQVKHTSPADVHCIKNGGLSQRLF